MKTKTTEAKKPMQALATKAEDKTQYLEEMTALYAKKKLAPETLTQSEIGTLAEAVKADMDLIDTLKPQKERVELGKKLLKEWFRASNETTLTTDNGTMVDFIPGTSLEVSALALINLLKKQRKTDLVDIVLKVAITEATKYLGRDVLEEIGTVTTDSYKTIKIR